MSETFEVIYEPYRKNNNDTFNEMYERYLKDPTRILTIDDTVYYKSMCINKLNLRQKCLLVMLPWEINPRRGCVLTDENDNQYEYLGIERFRFAGKIPEWYFKIAGILLSIPDRNIGIYFTNTTLQ